MKKILSIIMLIFVFSGNVNAELNDVKEFALTVEHYGNDCSGEKFDREIEISAKYIIGNSKIKLTKKRNGEILSIYVLTGANNDLCASIVQLETYSFGIISNSSGYEFFTPKRSYFNQRITANSPSYNHKKEVIAAAELMLKEFVIKWNESNQ